jgi:Prealbumin-like fold domain
VIKHVVKDNGGTATASQFTMTINGITATGGNSFPGAESPGTNKEVTPGSYSVTETGPSGYSASASADCSGTIAAGQTKTCTITNDDQAAHLIVIKHVIKDNGGTATASQFTMTINGITATGGNSFPGAESPGTNKTVTPGSYNVTETGPAGYLASASADCAGTIALGQTKTCTIVNNDIAPRQTQGYWKNHAAQTTALLPQKLGNYVVATFAQATAVFNKTNCSGSKTNDAIGCLAGQLLAAELNLANGASPCIQATVNKATSFLKGGTVTVGGKTAAGVNYVGPSGTYTLTATQRAIAVALASALDAYNQNKSCSNV